MKLSMKIIVMAVATCFCCIADAYYDNIICEFCHGQGYVWVYPTPLKITEKNMHMIRPIRKKCPICEGSGLKPCESVHNDMFDENGFPKPPKPTNLIVFRRH